MGMLFTVWSIWNRIIERMVNKATP
jgi:hypothetical protein